MPGNEISCFSVDEFFKRTIGSFIESAKFWIMCRYDLQIMRG